MANKKLTDFTPQTVLNYSTRLYGVPYSGTGAFTDTQVPISVLFDNTTFTGLTTVGDLAATTLTVGGATVVTLNASQTLTNKTLTAPVISTITNTGTLTLPTTTDTLVGRATTDTLTSKTLTSPTINSGALSGTFSGAPTFSGNVTFTSTITPSQTAGIVGTTTNNNANAGSVGELIQNTAAAVAASSGVTANLTSISLTPGDWEVTGMLATFPAGGTTTSIILGGISTTSATFGTINPGPPAVANCFLHSSPVPAGFQYNAAVPSVRVTINATTTVYLVYSVTFAVSTMQVGGNIRARRVR